MVREKLDHYAWRRTDEKRKKRRRKCSAKS